MRTSCPGRAPCAARPRRRSSRGHASGGAVSALALAASLALLLAASATAGAAPGAESGSGASASGTAIRIDGDLADWPAGTFAVADDRYVFLRLELPEARPIQSSPDSLVVTLDGGDDGDAPDASRLTLLFSPPTTDRLGVAVRARARDGGERDLSHAAVDLVVAPTVASRAFELRVARDVEGRPELRDLLGPGPVRVHASLRDANGVMTWTGPEHTVTLPPRATATREKPAPSEWAAGHASGGRERSSVGGMTHAAVAIPVAEPDVLRVVSWNVFLAAPRKTPAPFARVLRVLDPDVVLLQEWEDATPAELAQWFDTNVPGTEPWQAATSAGWGVAVVARGALAPLAPHEVARPASAPADARRGDLALRLASGVAATRLGRVCAASVHLKCCGADDSPQDVARRAEAEALQATLATALASAPPCVRVLGGDLNLVGSRRPLELLAAGLDAGGGALAIAATPVLGDAATYTWSQSTSTWSQSTSRFSPGRLDYLLHGATAATTVRSFVLDTRRLDDLILTASGLERGDASASDHLPLVLDLRPAPAPPAPAR